MRFTAELAERLQELGIPKGTFEPQPHTGPFTDESPFRARTISITILWTKSRPARPLLAARLQDVGIPKGSFEP